MPRLHVVGCPRSGTTLLMELLYSCFECHRIGGHEQSILSLRQSNFACNPDQVLLSKQPTDILHGRMLLTHDPQLHLIHVVRDPRAVISSRHIAGTGPGYFANYRIWKQCDVSARELLSHPRVLQLRYEDLVRHPDLLQQMIADYFPFLKQRHPFSEFSRHARPDAQACSALNGLRPIDTGSLDKWHGHLPRVKAQLLIWPWMQRDLEYYRYEHNADWQCMLDAVTPVSFPCRYSDTPQYLKEVEKKVRQWFKLRRHHRLCRRFGRGNAEASF